MTILNFKQILEGIRETKQGNTLRGLQLLNSSVNVSSLPEAKAWYGYCLARENNKFRQGISLCNEARQKDPDSSDICLALGRIYLLAGIRKSAVSALQTGLSLDNNPEIYRLLNSIGIRKPPVFSFLDRSSKVNVASGRLLSRVGMRKV